MIYKLFTHSWLSFWRSKSLTRSLGTTIFTWFMFGLILLYAVGLGYMLENVLLKIAPEKEVINFLNGLLLFYWVFELVFRLLFQKNVTLDIQYYLTQRISRKLLGHFMLIKSWVNLFLLISVLLFSRFAFSTIVATYDLAVTWRWFVFIFAVSFCLHHLVIFIHQFTKGKVLVPMLVTLVIFALGYGNYLGLIDSSFVTEELMRGVINSPFFILAPFGVSMFLYLYSHKLIHKNLTLDTLPQYVKEASSGISSWVSYLNSKGTTGQLIAIELRLIWRNKRPRMTMIMAPIMAIYFLVFFLRVDRAQEIVGLVVLIATGALMINYGQLLFSWESKYFDRVATANFTIEEYLKSKFILLIGFNTISLIVFGIGMLFIDTMLFGELLLWYFVNSGIFIYMFIWFGSIGSKRIDANASAMFNYEGIKASQFFIIIPYFIVPLGAKYLIDVNVGDGWGSLILGGVGIIGLLMFRPIMKMLTKSFLKRKYKILVGLRK